MTLTKKDLEQYQKNMQISIPDNLVNKLLEQYGQPVTDDAGHVFEYAEQDIHEQLTQLCQN